MSDKPHMDLVGQDGNIFGILGRASKLLRQAGQPEQAEEMSGRVFACGSYTEALRIVSEYVETELSVDSRKAEPCEGSEFTTQEISIDWDMDFSGAEITAYVETWFDTSQRFGLALGEGDSCDLYVLYDPNRDTCKAQLCIKFCDGHEEWRDVELTAGEKMAIVGKMEALCKTMDGKSLLETWQGYHSDNNSTKKTKQKEKRTHER